MIDRPKTKAGRKSKRGKPKSAVIRPGKISYAFRGTLHKRANWYRPAESKDYGDPGVD